MRRPAFAPGLPAPAMPRPSGSAATDQAFADLVYQLGGYRRGFGAVARPGDDIGAIARSLDDGDHLLLLPGTYSLRESLAFTQRVHLYGIGRAIVTYTGTVATFSGAKSVVRGVEFVRTSRGAGAGAVHLTANYCKVEHCTIESAGAYGVYVTSSQAAVLGCMFTGSLTVGDADIYYENGATYGIVSGNQWSGLAGTYVLDYQNLMNMSEAANGPSVNVRP